MTELRMLVVDLDGTTLNAESRLSPVDVEAAHALLTRGIQVTIATGRLFTGTRWVARALGVTGSVAVMNGSELIDVETATARYGRYLDRPIRQEIHRILKDRGLSTFLFESRRIHHGRLDERYARYLAIWTEDLSHHPDVFDAPSWASAEDLVAVGMVGPTEAVTAAREELHRALPSTVESVMFPTPVGGSFLKLRHSGEDKGTALGRMAEERGLTAAHCVAVGDWTNDIPMLKVAGRSFAMNHAGSQVRAAAHEVLDASRQGGAIAEVARRVWGIG